MSPECLVPEYVSATHVGYYPDARLEKEIMVDPASVWPRSPKAPSRPLFAATVCYQPLPTTGLWWSRLTSVGSFYKILLASISATGGEPDQTLSLSSFVSDLGEGRLLECPRDMLDLAKRAVVAASERTDENIEEWAATIAEDVANADD